MKVKDLEVGMLLKPVPNRYFNSQNDEWLWVSAITKHRRPSHWSNIRPIAKASVGEYALYLGTKKDLGINGVAWSDRYVLFQDKVLAVDPYVWRNIDPVEK